MSTEPSTPESLAEPRCDHEYALDPGFEVRASGPARRVENHGRGVTTHSTVELSIDRRLRHPTVVGKLADVPEHRERKQVVTQLLTCIEEGNESFTVSEGMFADWSITIDGPIEAYVNALVEWGRMLDDDGNIIRTSDTSTTVDLPTAIQCIAKPTRKRETAKSPKEELINLTGKLHDSDVWGIGATVAHFDARRKVGEGIPEDVIDDFVDKAERTE
jgi:hypothetical protein